MAFIIALIGRLDAYRTTDAMIADYHAFCDSLPHLPSDGPVISIPLSRVCDYGSDSEMVAVSGTPSGYSRKER